MNEHNNRTLDTIEKEVLRIFKKEKQLDDSFTKTTNLKKMGMDSLLMVRVLVGIEQSMGIWLEGKSLTPEVFLDVEHIAAHIHELLSKGAISN